MKDWRVAQKMIVFLFNWKEKIKQIIYIWHCINYEKQKTRTILKEKNRKRINFGKHLSGNNKKARGGTGLRYKNYLQFHFLKDLA